MTNLETVAGTVRRTTMTNKNYRCYFTDAGDRIRTYEQIECADDTVAALKVDELLAVSEYSSAELWEGKRLVGKWAVNGHADPNGKHFANGTAEAK
jgi:hypothetical protein